MGILKGVARDVGFNGIASVPEVETSRAIPQRPPAGAARVPRRKASGGNAIGTTPVQQVPGLHPEGRYLETTETVGRYRNVGSCTHMLSKLVRLSSGTAPSIDWQLCLRGGDHHGNNSGWRRHFARPAQSFDTIREKRQDPEYRAVYEASQCTPEDKSVDRNKSGISIATIREVPDTFERESGCEGADASHWQHIIKTKGVHRGQMVHHTTLRTYERREAEKSATPASDVTLGDNRSDVALLDMMGKKKWYSSQSANPRAAAPPVGDARMHYLSVLHVTAEADDEIRRLRMATNSSRCSSRGSARSAFARTPSPAFAPKTSARMAQPPRPASTPAK